MSIKFNKLNLMLIYLLYLLFLIIVKYNTMVDNFIKIIKGYYFFMNEMINNS